MLTENYGKINCFLLCAGRGKRLRPFTDLLPKCLSPIGHQPLLKIWLDKLSQVNVDRLFINLNYLSNIVDSFLSDMERVGIPFSIERVFEKELRGTAGALNGPYAIPSDKPLLVIHGDNLSAENLDRFLSQHFSGRNSGILMSMMSFTTEYPESCGIIEVDKSNLLLAMHEKSQFTNGNSQANAAIYILEPELIRWIQSEPQIHDFSTEVIPEFYGRISVWHSDQILIDIGSEFMLKKAQTFAHLFESQSSTLNLDIEQCSENWVLPFRAVRSLLG